MSGSMLREDRADRWLTAVLEVTRQMTATLDLTTLLNQVEKATLRVLDCERVSVFLCDKGSRLLCSRLATGGAAIQVPVDCGIAGTAYRMRSVINVANVNDDPRFYAEVDRSTGFRTQSLLCIPLIGHDAEAIGVLEALNKRGGRFTSADEDLGTALGALTGIALQRHALLEAHASRQKVERELEVARDIQRSLLPRSDPQVPGFDIAGWNQPAEATGGDFYDYLTLPDGRAGFVLADVSGHGLGSSLLASECRALIRATAATTGDLATIVAKTNELLYADFRSERFVTVFLAALNAETSCLEYISGGHPALLVSEAITSGWSALDSTTMPLGILPQLDDVSTATLELSPGDTLLLLTDGLFEWEDRSDQPFGMHRAAAIVQRFQRRSASELIRELHTSLMRFANGTTQIDDVTAVVVKRM